MTKFHVVTFYLLIVLSACQNKKTDTPAEGVSPDAATSAESAILTDAQKAEGWIALFDGKSMNGWRTFQNKENGSWEVKDGALHSLPFDSRKITEHADLMTNDEFENFELSIEWKVAPKSNSGIIYRVTEEFKEPYLSGPEYQVLDDQGYPGEVKETNHAGGAYDMYAPENKTLKPVGEWNTTKIVAKGTHIEHWLNGAKVLEYEIGSAEWKKRKDGSKWNDAKGYGSAKKGHLDLQDHGDEVWYRNILVHVL